MEETINGNVYKHTNYIWYGVGHQQMMDLGIILIKDRGQQMESRISQRKTYLVEIMYYENHNTEAVTITTDNINWSMTEYQRNRKPFSWEILDWKQEVDERTLQDSREIDAQLRVFGSYLDTYYI